jgi:hypothetical protein
MKKSTSSIVGGILAAIAVCFVGYAAGHPEASFPWSNRITFMIYGAYVWLLLKFLVDIPFLSKKRKMKSRGNWISVLGYFCMAVVFFLMEVTGDKVDIFTILRGFIVVCAVDFGLDGLGVLAQK